jgi:hypothetical protein
MVVADEDTREMRLASWNLVRIAYLFVIWRCAAHLMSLLWFCYAFVCRRATRPRRFFFYRFGLSQTVIPSSAWKTLAT